MKLFLWRIGPARSNPSLRDSGGVRVCDDNSTYTFIANYFLRVIPVTRAGKGGYDGPARSTRDSMRVTHDDR
jgi:hypothetical protein